MISVRSYVDSDGLFFRVVVVVAVVAIVFLLTLSRVCSSIDRHNRNDGKGRTNADTAQNSTWNQVFSTWREIHSIRCVFLILKHILQQIFSVSHPRCFLTAVGHAHSELKQKHATLGSITILSKCFLTPSSSSLSLSHSFLTCFLFSEISARKAEEDFQQRIDYLNDCIDKEKHRVVMETQKHDDEVHKNKSVKRAVWKSVSVSVKTFMFIFFPQC